MLTIVAVAISVMLVLGVEKVRKQSKSSFTNTIAGTDLIVGARSGPIQLLLYSVFRIGNPTNNISWQSYQEIAANPQVKWTIPISLGDSHRGYRVMGTHQDYFRFYRYGQKRPLKFVAGDVFDDLYDAVVGFDVAKQLNYQLDQQIIIAHGAGATSFTQHKDKPFRISGILAKTGTPVDRTVHVSLEAIEAIHLGWESGMPASRVTAEQSRAFNLQPKVITAFMVGLNSRIASFKVQRMINEYRNEPLLAILPGVALQQLWSMISIVEQALFTVSALVVAAGLLGMLTMLLASLHERRREMALLRSVGARPWHIFSLLMLEATLIAIAGCAFGLFLLYAGLYVLQPIVENEFGIFIAITAPGTIELLFMLTVIGAAFITSLIPAWRAYRNSLADGVTMRI